MRYSLTFLLTIFIACQIKAQRVGNSIYPEIGKPCPDFVLRNVNYYHKNQVSLKDFSGRWLILDFWDLNCGACIASFPGINAKQREFASKVNFMMVGLQDKQNKIAAVYAKFKQALNLAMPCAFDSLIFKKWDHPDKPYIVVIDTKGIVRGITSQITSANIHDFLDGKTPALRKAYREHEKRSAFSFNAKAPFLVNGNGGSDTTFLSRSMISEWKDNMPQSIPIDIENNNDARVGHFQVLGTSLQTLYLLAFAGVSAIDRTLYGNFYPYAALEITDSALFKPNYGVNPRNVFCYSLFIPASQASTATIQQTLQRDLQNTFGFNGSLETRKCPYWKITATEDAVKRLKAKGDSTFLKIDRSGASLRNKPLSELLRVIKGKMNLPILDETGFAGNIDIDVVTIDGGTIKKSLESNGLALTKGEKDMKVIVIRDQK